MTKICITSTVIAPGCKSNAFIAAALSFRVRIFVAITQSDQSVGTN